MTRTLADFIGRYAVAREIEDHLTGGRTRFTGVAEIVAQNAGAHYRERGRLTLPTGQEVMAERRYLWRPEEEAIAVDFADGAPFHRFDPSLGGAASAHLCGADVYRGGYDFTGWPEWSLLWEVSGPRKSYRSRTVFRPDP
ncbi:DUF6314 family protein [Thalassorhabdomicrobium marinisediminis]|uniref:DUF6314 domain-containing protein n=1 Tax=Thalassorhabdomicrobium marinisediminis TaxID=2170577 RepID=A0A2T7G0T9_9RHOB|nr:DUF6314 family protein [Thalassorhabdomicrobium marinisediminis]PVA08029.1 hypothetical protein DC363_00575 [Thalassorhabdomicrobium marinisediminis]